MSFFPHSHQTQLSSGNSQQQISQELFTTQDLQGPREFHEKFFQTQISQKVSQRFNFTQNFFQSQVQDENIPTHSFGLFGVDKDNDMFSSNESSSESSIESSSNNLRISDDALFNSQSQESFSQASFIATPTFISIPTQNNIPINPQTPSQQLISQATTAHSKLTIKYDLKDSIDQKIPQSVMELYNEVKKHFSDWTFVSIIVGQLCSEKFPMGSYHNLKLALLMSLVTSHDSPMHIMAIGSEMSTANVIMRELGELAERFVPVTNKTSDGIVISKYGTCEAGPLVLASRGVSFIGYWQQLKPKIKTQLIREIETNTLLVQKAQKHIPLESSVWAHWNCIMNLKKDIASLDQIMK